MVNYGTIIYKSEDVYYLEACMPCVICR